MSNLNDTTAFDNHELEKMRYNNNSLSYKLGFLGLGCSVIAAFIALNSFGPSDFSTIIKVLMNIVVLLVGFLATEKVKVYKKEYSYVICTLGVISFARIFWVPLQLFIYYNKFMNVFAGTKEGFDEAQKLYGNKLGKTVIGSWENGQRVKTGYLTMNGNVRAIIIIVFLVISGVSFISSGIINYRRSIKLNNYLSSIGEKH